MSIDRESKRIELFATIAKQDEEAMVKLLKEDPELVNAYDVDEYSAIHKCAKHGTASMMHRLITEFNADVNSRTYAKHTPTIIAAEYNNIPCLLELLRNNADTTLQNRQWEDPLDMMAHNHPEINPFNKTGNFLTLDGDHLAVKMGENGVLVDLSDFLN